MAWTPAWSSKITAPVASLVAGPGWCLFGHERRMTLMADDGGHRWTHDLLFTPHRVVVAGSCGVLAAHGFTVHRFDDGTPVNEGRAVSRGFSALIARPGGGWLASGREGDLHLFTKEGRGRSRATRAPVRSWSDGSIGPSDRARPRRHAPAGPCWERRGPCGLRRGAWTWVSSLTATACCCEVLTACCIGACQGPQGGTDRAHGQRCAGAHRCGSKCRGMGAPRTRRPNHVHVRGSICTRGAALGDPVLLLGGDGSETLTGVTREGLIRCWYGVSVSASNARHVALWWPTVNVQQIGLSAAAVRGCGGGRRACRLGDSSPALRSARTRGGRPTRAATGW